MKNAFWLTGVIPYKSKGILKQSEIRYIYKSLMELRSNKTSFNSFKNLY